MKRSVLLVLLIMLPVFGYGQNASDSISISTYYPSPHGVYKTIKLIPDSTRDPIDCDSSKRGEIYFDDVNNQVKVCKEDQSGTWTWSVLGGLSETEKYNAEDFCITDEYGEEVCLSDVQKISDQQLLVKGDHSAGDCRKAGGEVVDSDVGASQCRFTRSTCPSGWNQYKSFCATTDRTCSCNGGYEYRGRDTRCTTSCSVSAHAWANKIPDCCKVMCCYQIIHDGYCFSCNRCKDCWNFGSSACKVTTCTAPILQIGCY